MTRTKNQYNTMEESGRALYRMLIESGHGDLIDLIIQLAALKRCLKDIQNSPDDCDLLRGEILPFPKDAMFRR